MIVSVRYAPKFFAPFEDYLAYNLRGLPWLLPRAAELRPPWLVECSDIIDDG